MEVESLKSLLSNKIEVHRGYAPSIDEYQARIRTQWGWLQGQSDFPCMKWFASSWGIIRQKYLLIEYKTEVKLYTLLTDLK